jgi:hypothetical protein
MKIARIGLVGKERPVVVVENRAYFVDSIIDDWSRDSLEAGAFAKVRGADLSTLECVEFGLERIGAYSPHKINLYRTQLHKAYF